MTAKKKKAQGDAASTPKEAATSGSLPFEPVRPKQPKPVAPALSKPTPSKPSTAKPSTTAKQSLKGMPSASGIPEVVNRRMVSRAAFFCGVPTACAILTFVASYLAIANDLFKPPTVAVLLVSLGFFGLGVLGLSYGPLSASWDEERLGNALGFDEFKLNFGRLRDSWRAAKAAKDSSPD
ncbi:MAG: PAM68 family protein [Leptolyngbya sp. BL-A-14]